LLGVGERYPEVLLVPRCLLLHGLDVNATDADLRQIACDYLVANGLFTAKFVMSKAVNWERSDLFHVSMDKTVDLLHRAPRPDARRL
jgi:hypothetical protein